MKVSSDIPTAWRSRTPPSSGGVGTRLNTARPTFIMTILWTSSPRRGEAASRNEPTTIATRAMARLVAGPANVTSTSSRARCRKFERFTLTGFAHAMNGKLLPNAKMLNRGRITVPRRSRCTRGLSVTRPSMRGVSSPSRSATMAWPHSWSERLAMSRMNVISPLRTKMGSISIGRSFSLVPGQPGNQLLLLRLQGRVAHRSQDLAGLTGLFHVQEDICLVKAHRLAFDLGLSVRLEPLPGLERSGPIRLPQVVEGLGVPVGELDPVRSEFGGAPEGLLHRVVDGRSEERRVGKEGRSRGSPY